MPAPMSVSGGPAAGGSVLLPKTLNLENSCAQTLQENEHQAFYELTNI